MNRSVENLLRPLCAPAAERRADRLPEWPKSPPPECATRNDQGAPESQRVFHKEAFGLSRCGAEATTEECGLVNDKGLRLNAATGDGIDLYLVGTRAKGFGRRAQPGQRSNQRVASSFVS